MDGRVGCIKRLFRTCANDACNQNCGASSSRDNVAEYIRGSMMRDGWEQWILNYLAVGRQLAAVSYSIFSSYCCPGKAHECRVQNRVTLGGKSRNS